MTGNVARMRESEIVYMVLVRKLLGKRPFGIPRRLEGNTKIDLNINGDYK
jgi:hypothetical protein